MRFVFVCKTAFRDVVDYRWEITVGNASGLYHLWLIGNEVKVRIEILAIHPRLYIRLYAIHRHGVSTEFKILLHKRMLRVVKIP
jgi:hypothetical protein